MIEIEAVTKIYNNGYKAVDNVSLQIKSGEFFALLGPSGCGKTTLLRMIAGFLTPEFGKIVINGEDITNDPPYKRKVNMVFQSYAVFPHMNVYDNIAYGLKIDKLSKLEISKKVAEVLELVQLKGHDKSFPDQLSGGQRQRVAVARALAKSPKALLLDEPLSALDAKLRESMRSELVKIQKRANVTFIFVTHDQTEALGLANRISVMRGGKILQTGQPFEIYEHPNNSFIADFIGSTNLLTAKKINKNKILIAGLNEIELDLDDSFPDNLFITLRPEKIGVINKSAPKDSISITGKIEEFVYLGDKTIIRVQLASGEYINCALSEFERRDLGQIFEHQEVTCYWDKHDMRPLAE